jgi:hypothetical protein
MNNLWQIVQWLRCGAHTGWSHELDYHLDRCRYCNQAWETVYPRTGANTSAAPPRTGPSGQASLVAPVRLRPVARGVGRAE